MKLEYKKQPNRTQRPPRDSKCQYGCGFDSAGKPNPIQSIEMHETRCKKNPSRKVWTTGKGKPNPRKGKAGPRHREARDMLEVLRAENDVNRRITQALGIMFPEGVVISEEFIVWLEATRKMMLNGDS